MHASKNSVLAGLVLAIGWMIVGCSDEEGFTSGGRYPAKGGGNRAKDQSQVHQDPPGPSDETVVEDPPISTPDDETKVSGDGQEVGVNVEVEEPTVNTTVEDGGAVTLDDEEIEDNACYVDQGTRVGTVAVSGENCIQNKVDAGGADFNDYHVEIDGDLSVDGFQVFSEKDQTLTINYRLGSPAGTQQNVQMQVVDCDGNMKAQFSVSSGNGTRELEAAKGDRFNIVTRITGGCYGRRDVYDMLKLGKKAFRIR